MIGAKGYEIEEIFKTKPGEIVSHQGITYEHEYKRCERYAENFPGGAKSVLIGKVCGKMINYAEMRVDVYVLEQVADSELRGTKTHTAWIKSETAEGLTSIANNIHWESHYAAVKRSDLSVVAVWRGN